MRQKSLFCFNIAFLFGILTINLVQADSGQHGNPHSWFSPLNRRAYWQDMREYGSEGASEKDKEKMISVLKKNANKKL